MNQYVEVKEVRSKNMDRYLEQGWEIIDTTKTLVDLQETQLYYHIGYPLRKRLEDLEEVISIYEKRGLKERLFRDIAEEHGIDYDDITEEEPIFSFGPSSLNNELTRFMEKYEYMVRREKVQYRSKKSNDEQNKRFEEDQPF
ncbi:hypothetical protein Q5W88_01065 [Shouchella clausii]|uniref:hypothetical protein n=1 Tax=Shouchella clausii TaxID=79880 RepID=UPI0026F43C04|nr:hypothetical protein [Shouchella clausii]MDO7281724.1 hypothetical protein [Shouchella clausii]MDO7301819.1 hypothetical protein [Shouchella clausii]